MAEDLIRQSVLDRLIGADRVEEMVFPEEPPAQAVSGKVKKPTAPRRPTIHRRLPRTWDESVEVLRRNVLRDLEQLLNARQISDPVSAPYEHLERSAYNYGLRDLTTFSADAPDTPAALQRMIERAIAIFEPRILEARVKLTTDGNTKSSRIKFVISGILRTDPEPERVEFDTVLEVASKRFEVSNRVSDAG